MWGALLEWVKAVGLGSLVGVFVGAGLTRRAQDRQFARQQKTQRIDRARAAYQDGEVVGHKLVNLLIPHKDKGLIGKQAVDRISAVPQLAEDMLAAAVRLESEGASNVARALNLAWPLAYGMHQRVAATIEMITWADEVESRELDFHQRRWQQLGSAVDEARKYWTQWLVEQESPRAARRTRWFPRPRRRDRTTALVQPRPNPSVDDQR